MFERVNVLLRHPERNLLEGRPNEGERLSDAELSSILDDGVYYRDETPERLTRAIIPNPDAGLDVYHQFSLTGSIFHRLTPEIIHEGRFRSDDAFNRYVSRYSDIPWDLLDSPSPIKVEAFEVEPDYSTRVDDIYDVSADLLFYSEQPYDLFGQEVPQQEFYLGSIHLDTSAEGSV